MARMTRLADRDEARLLASEHAWEEGVDCPHCGGSGRAEGGRKRIHSVLGGIGADWDLDEVLAAIDSAVEVRWGDGFMDHDLLVVVPNDGLAGRYLVYAFQVPSPTKVAS